MHELKEAIQLAAQRDLESAQQEIAEKDRHIAQLEEMRKRQSFGSPGDTSRSPQGKLTEEEKDALYEYKKTVQAYADREIEAVQNKANHECEEMAFRKLPYCERLRSSKLACVTENVLCEQV